MYELSLDQRTRIIQAICEGNSIRATCRLTGAAKGTVLRLLAEVGAACQTFHNATVRNVTATRVQCDEIWSFCHAKARNVPADMVGQAGDLWTWVALDQDSKLAISWLVADRGPEAATVFARDLASRLANRIQLTTDGNSVYLAAVPSAFHYDVDYAMLVKRYGAAPVEDARRYSPAICTGATKTWVSGNPRIADVSTSHVERQKPDDADAESPLHAPDQRLLEEGGEPRAGDGAVLHALQLLPRASDPYEAGEGDSSDPGDGGRLGASGVEGDGSPDAPAVRAVPRGLSARRAAARSAPRSAR